jgi:hypothetical protein
VKDFTREEVVEALKGIKNLKSPRLDGLPTLFCKASGLGGHHKSMVTTHRTSSDHFKTPAHMLC